jgi:peptidoglycan/LPS O-acetylase OafA/YrhL
MDFRRDINFLRAIAVVLVVIYHFGVPGFSGGFVGVDVFFVISGYLMTGILLKPQQSPLGFYAARGRRIIPALAVLCAVLLAAGAIFLTPADYVALSGQAGASIAFVSNISSWWREGDYFGPNANANWLLHTWSLSVEWQFYMLYPLFLISVMRASRAPRVLGSAIAAARCLSLLLGIYFSPRKSIAAFYLLPMRAWELLLGGVICVVRPSSLSPRWRVGGSLAGLLVIYASAAIFDGQDLWPHYWALIPTLGAALIIYANAETALFRVEAVQFIGRASYSIYLWHWPVVVGLNYLDVAHSFAVVAGGIGLSLIAGALSYLYVETPSRRMLAEPSRARVRAVACFAAVPAVAAISLAVMKLEGLPNRVGSQVQAVLSEETNGFQAAEDCSNPERGCDIGQGSTMAVLWGDSHANALATALEERQGRVKMFFMGACPTVFGAFVPRFDQDRKRAEFNQKVWETVRRLPEDIPLIIANRTSVYIEGFNEMSGGPLPRSAMAFRAPPLSARRCSKRGCATPFARWRNSVAFTCWPRSRNSAFPCRAGWLASCSSGWRQVMLRLPSSSI